MWQVKLVTWISKLVSVPKHYVSCKCTTGFKNWGHQSDSTLKTTVAAKAELRAKVGAALYFAASFRISAALRSASVALVFPWLRYLPFPELRPLKCERLPKVSTFQLEIICVKA